MKRSQWILLGLVLLTAVGGATFAVVRWKANQPKAEPRYGGKTTPEWIEALGESEPQLASATMSDLKALKATALPVFLEARKSANLRVHRRAVELLIACGESAADPLVQALPHGGARVEVALVRLGELAVPELEKALSGKDGATAARVLGLIGERAKAAVPALVGLVQDGGVPTATRVAAVQSLGRIGAELGPDVLVLEDDPIVPTLTAALASEELRLQAARALESLGWAARPAIPDLARLVREKDGAVAGAACQALGATGAPGAAVPLVAQLARPDRAAADAGLALARLGAAARPALPALIAALKSDKQEGQLARAVLERLGEFAVPELQEALGSPEAEVRAGAARVLGLLGPRARPASEVLIARLSDDKPAVALAAAQVLTWVDLPNAAKTVAPLGKLLGNKDAAIASGAAFVIADLGSVAAPLVPALLAMLRGKDEKSAARAAALLGGIKPSAKGVIEALVAGLNGSTLVRKACIESLGRLGEASKIALPALRTLLDETALRPFAALALARISRDEVTLVADKLSGDLASKEESVSFVALSALASMDPPPVEALPYLRPLLGNVRLGGQTLLVVAGMDLTSQAKVIPDLITALGSADERIQMQAAALLSEIGVLAAPGLVQALKSPSRRTRVGAMMALRSTAFKAAVKNRMPLLDALENDDLVLREAAGEALSVLGVQTKSDVQRVSELLARPEADLRRFAVRIVGSIPDLAPAIAECLLDPDEMVRELAAASVRDASESLLIGAAEDASYRVRCAVLWNMPEKIPNARQRLEQLTQVVDAVLLLEIAQRSAFQDEAWLKVLREPLQQAMRGDNLGQRMEAAMTLYRLDPKEKARAERFLESVLVGWDASARLRAAITLSVLLPPPAGILPTLLHRQQVEPQREVRVVIDRLIEKRRP